MMTGAERAEAAPEEGLGTDQSWIGPAQEPVPEPPQERESASVSFSSGVRAFGALLILLALGWAGAFGWWLWTSRPPLTLPAIISAVPMFSAPLILLALLWLWLGRTPRREAERFTRAVEAMRSESTALQAVLEIVSDRIDENQGRLRGGAEKLMSLGDEASDRLGRVTYYLSKETANLEKQAAALDAAASAARVDIGVLMHDLPRAEEQARAVGEAMKEAGLAAHGQASALEAQLSALTARGREADETLGGSAQRMAAHLAQLESGAVAAGSAMDGASQRMTASVDAAMARAAEAVDAARSGLEAQSAAVLAAIEHNRAALDRAGEDAAKSLGQRLEEVGGRMEALAAQLGAQDVASRTLVEGLRTELAEVDSWFERVGRTQSEESGRVGEALAALREAAGELIAELGSGTVQADGLIERTRSMAGALADVSATLRDELPARLGQVESHAARAREAADGLLPVVESVEASAQRAAAEAGAAEQAVARQREALDALLARIAEGGADAAEQLRLLDGAAAAAEASARALRSELGVGTAEAETLATRSRDMADALAAIAGQLSGALPEGLGRIEAQTERTREAAAALAPALESVEATTERAATRAGETEASIGRQREAVEALLGRIAEGGATAEEQLRALGGAAAEAQEASARIVAETGPELIDALVRVREAANQAAERAREAIAATIPASAAALGDAGREALSAAIAETVEQQMAELSSVSERAMATARAASERLTRQMLVLSETTAAIEERIDDARRERESRERQNLSRRVALLIESLNSTAIDVTKILSNEVTDSAWAAYLKGDRGVFTRRAVRLLDTAEAREVMRHYEEEPEFREQVNRYIHDFEAMLRPILADRDGGPLGITLLSSDMGKLYVALAQAIERLRT
jgi:hypothetical protein